MARHSAIAASFLAIALILGGGGTPNPATEVWLQLVFVAAALAWVWTGPRDSAGPALPPGVVWLVCVLAPSLPLLQLLPLPPAIWTALGDEDNRAAALALVDGGQSWQPLTQYPSRTLASVLA